MEYVGKRVKRELLGGALYGSIDSFNSSDGLFKIVYDGDCRESEFLDLSQVSLISEPSEQKGGAGEGYGNSSGLAGKVVRFDLNMDPVIDLNDEEASCVNDHGDVSRVGLKGLDLNVAVADDGLYSGLGEKKGTIDLNLDVNEEDFGVSSGGGSVLGIDLNLRFIEDRSFDGCEGRSGEGAMFLDAETNEDGVLKDSSCGLFDGEDIALTNAEKEKRSRKRKNVSCNNVQLATPENVNMGLKIGNSNFELEEREETTGNDGGGDLSHLTNSDNGNPDRVSSGRRVRKRGELATNDKTLAMHNTELRSSRRPKRTEVSSQAQVSSKAKVDDEPSPAISAVSSERITMTGLHQNYSVVHDTLPPKVDLPPSSRHLDLCGVPMFDLASVYSFLRSFSTLLFLSPFELDDFVLSVTCTDSTLLFDSIHVSMLKALRKHLEFLSGEGSASASTCLRSLNWDYLDLITWPMFMVEYLIMHSPGYIPGLDLSQLKVYQCDYYTLPVSTKVEILQHLCDDIVEAEPFRSELRDRKLAAEQRIDLGRKTRFCNSRKRKPVIDVSTSHDTTEETVQEPSDGNGDECFLCKNVGNLICCDGCPAAFHSRCVGVISSQLPEGAWYCPECSIGKDKPWMKMEKSYCGVELLGTDPYGRRFYSSCGYLLVLESSDDKYSYWFYTRDDLHLVISALGTSPCIYAEIVSAISKRWDVVRQLGGPQNDLDTRSYSAQSDFPKNVHLRSIYRALENNEAFTEKRSEAFEMKMDNHLASSEVSAEVTQSFEKTDYSSSAKTSEAPVDCNAPEKQVIAEDHSMTAGLVLETGSDHELRIHTLSASESAGTSLEVSYGMGYANRYMHAWMASMCYEQSVGSDGNSKGVHKPVRDMLAGQTKVVSNKCARFSWSNVHSSDMNSKKEKCGWCFYCRFPKEEKDCLFIMSDSFPAVEKFTSELLGICARKNRRNHLTHLLCHIICMEEHLQGLLLGPWLDPRYSVLWRKDAIGVVDFASLKDLLLKLESNLHRLVLSADWWKHVDSVSTMGSAAHIIHNSSRASAKHGSARKSTKSSAKSASGFLWWRGGVCSRRLFNWKVLPRSLASKAARQGGGKKIPGVLYPENGEHAKRSKRDAWRAAVETSRSVDQLALQVRVLDESIKWDEIGNTNIHLGLDKESERSAQSFMKAVVRRKCSDGPLVKYLLDFGKTRFIPKVISRHGTVAEDSSSEKKQFWLEESHVPLYLLKAFKEKQNARRSSKLVPAEFHESRSVVQKPLEKKGFAYLFSRAERSKNYRCAHCHKDVLIREAVSCLYCNEFFHKKHVRKSAGSVTAECEYSCHKCKGGGFVNAGSRKRKSGSPNLKSSSKRMKSLTSSVTGEKMRKNTKSVKSKSKEGVPPDVAPVRHSARYAERVLKLSLQNKRKRKHKRAKRCKFVQPQRRKRKTTKWSYWLNGLLLSRREDDQAIRQFRSRKLIILPGEATSMIRAKPKCSICGELEPKSDSIYVSCETCGAWFHGDALQLTPEKIEILAGFKCYKCLDKGPPICPHRPLIGSNEAGVVSEYESDAEGPEN